jgi:DNA-binding NarL/FixJ family response regulator
VNSLRPRVLLVDDSAEMLDVFERILSPSCDVVGQITDARLLPDAVTTLQVEVAVLDLYMSTGNGLELCRSLKEAFPHLKVVIVTASQDPHLKAEALARGASSLVDKVRMIDDLERAVHKAVAG